SARFVECKLTDWPTIAKINGSRHGGRLWACGKLGGAEPVRAPKTRCLSRQTRLGDLLGGIMPLRMRVHDREPIGAALRRFKKLLERSGLTKELRKRKHYEKPSEIRRRAELRKQSAIRKAKLQSKQVG